MNITVLAGGVGGAKFLRGLRQHLRQTQPDGSGGTAAEVTVVVNTGDDLWLTGLRVCPDLDSIMYTLGGANDEVRGWGRLGESERVSAELTAYGVGWPWFTLGDLDLGTHITRSHLLAEGLTLSQATAQITARWNLGVTLLPMSDQPVETHVVVADEQSASGTRTMHFEEWWVRYRASLPALRFEQHGIESAVAAPGVVEAILGADVVLVAPSNPVVSIGTILPVPGIRAALQQTPAPVVGVSPIISGSPVRGMAKACLDAIGVAVAADAVGLHYGARSATRAASAMGATSAAGPTSAAGRASATGGILDVWLVDESDAALAPGIEAAGLRAITVPLWMTTVESSTALAAAALDAAAAVTSSAPAPPAA